MKNLIRALIALCAGTIAAQAHLLERRPNESILRCDGAPIRLIGYGDYGILTEAEFDYTRFLDELARRRLNFFRVWINYHWTKSLSPFLKLPGGKFDLTRYDPSFFERLRNLARAADERGIIIQVCLFDGVGQEANDPLRWSQSPYHPANNINGLSQSPSDYSKKPSLLWAQVQMPLVDRVVSELGSLGNIVYEVCNEPASSDPRVSQEFVESVAARLRAKLAGRPGSQVISVNADSGALISWAQGSSAVDLLSFHVNDKDVKFDPRVNLKKPAIISNDGDSSQMTADFQGLAAGPRLARTQQLLGRTFNTSTVLGHSHFEFLDKGINGSSWKSKNYNPRATLINRSILDVLASWLVRPGPTAPESPVNGIRLSRQGPDVRYVDMVTGRVRLRFDTYYGGAPLEWYVNQNGQETELLSPPPKAGTGFQLVYETGQDATQASANGITPFRIARTVDPVDVLNQNNYYCREVLPAEWPSGCNYYRVVGFAPFFWASLDAIDDAYPPFTRSLPVGIDPHTEQSGWMTSRPGIADAGVPLWFRSQPGKPAGIVMIGNEMKPVGSASWNRRLLEIPEGRFACRIRVGFGETTAGAIAGIMFRRQVPVREDANIDDAYAAPGYTLYVNYAGDLEIIRVQGGQDRVWKGQLSNASRALLRSASGTQLELRTHNAMPGRVEIYADHVALGVYNDPQPILGPHFGLFATAPANTFIRFAEREVFDVGTEFQSTVTALPDGVLETEMILRPAPGVTSSRSYYRVVNSAFLSSRPDYLAQIATESPAGQILAARTDGMFAPRLLSSQGTIVFGPPAPADAYGLWVGQPEGSVGLYCVPMDAQIDGRPAPGPHALLGSHNVCSGCSAVPHPGSILHINALDFSNNATPQPASSVLLRARWATQRLQPVR